MARPTLKNNPKYLLLIRELRAQGITASHVRGLLEELWDSCHECGNPLIKSARHVEAAAGWEGEPGVLCAALVGTKEEGGFLDQNEDGSFQVHDYWDHAPDYVRKRAAREADRQAKGKSLSELRAEAGARGGNKRWQTDSKRKQIAITPAPAPAPLINMPENKQTEANGIHLLLDGTENAQDAQPQNPGTVYAQTEDRASQGQPAALLEQIYAIYPRREAKKRALEAIAQAVSLYGHERILAATRAYALSKRNIDPKYLPYAARWFDEERYLDHETTQETQTDRTQEAIAEGQAMLARGLSYNDTMSRLYDQYGDGTTSRAVRLAGWKRSDYPGAKHATATAS